RALLRRLSAGLATEVRECTNGAEAVAAYAVFQPDWTLMDIAMPVLNGLEATAQIVAADPQARIIVITQLGDPEFVQAALNAGAVQLVPKEDLSQLPHILREA